MLSCKKCKGNHLTIKCYNKSNKSNNNSNNKYNNKKQLYTKRLNNKNVTGIKISNLPSDITIKELNDLLQPWGKIGNINFGKSVNVTAYIDFYDNNEAEYFIRALDKTPFDNLILNVELNKKN